MGAARHGGRHRKAGYAHNQTRLGMIEDVTAKVTTGDNLTGRDAVAPDCAR